MHHLRGNAIPAGPLSDFLAIFTKLVMGGCPRSVASRQTLRLWIKKCGLTCAKIAKIGNFWYKFSTNGYIPLTDFFKYKIWRRDGLPGLHPRAKFNHCHF